MSALIPKSDAAIVAEIRHQQIDSITAHYAEHLLPGGDGLFMGAGRE
jgi:hypothetical protein